jgi:antitoxin (DNA-binding transcriptional repressor) of toxin-antitoxin stability system
MDEVTAQYLRQHWRDGLDAAQWGNQHLTVTYHESPVAVLVPPGWWERATTATGAPRTGQELSVTDARIELHRRLNAAREGEYTIIRRHKEPAAVLVPCAWHANATAALSAGDAR